MQSSKSTDIVAVAAAFIAQLGHSAERKSRTGGRNSVQAGPTNKGDRRIQICFDRRRSSADINFFIIERDMGWSSALPLPS